MLYRVGTVNVFGTEDNPRITAAVRLCSDIVVLTQRPIWTARVPLVPPTTQSPREWLLEALEGLKTQ